MGGWTMTIIGTGAHHNYSRDKEWREENDADVQFEKFVEILRKSGHNISYASATFGTTVDLNTEKDK